MNKFVVHCKKHKFDVLCARPSKWGNQFVIGKDGTREEVIEKYREWIMSRPDVIEKCKQELRGKILGCWCSPNQCHCDILAEIANE